MALLVQLNLLRARCSAVELGMESQLLSVKQQYEMQLAEREERMLSTLERYEDAFNSIREHVPRPSEDRRTYLSDIKELIVALGEQTGKKPSGRLSAEERRSIHQCLDANNADLRQDTVCHRSARTLAADRSSATSSSHMNASLFDRARLVDAVIRDEMERKRAHARQRGPGASGTDVGAREGLDIIPVGIGSSTTGKAGGDSDMLNVTPQPQSKDVRQ